MSSEALKHVEEKNISQSAESHEGEWHSAISRWVELVIDGFIYDEEIAKEQIDGMLRVVRETLPESFTITGERTCNLDCSHCLFQWEESSKKASEAAHLSEIVTEIVRRIPIEAHYGDVKEKLHPRMLYDGRILRKWHLELFKQLREARSDLRIGAIDNGTYTRLLRDFKNFDLRLDWLDISVDGTPEHHDAQRASDSAFADALHGLEHGREIAKKVTSLMTLTNLNYQDVGAVATMLFGENPASSAHDPETGKQLSYADEVHVMLVSPYRRETSKSLVLNRDQFAEAFQGLRAVRERFPDRRITLRMYQLDHFQLFCEMIGKDRMRDMLKSDEFLVHPKLGAMVFKIDGVSVEYFPQSIWPLEGILIDADGALRTPGSQTYTLADYKRGTADGKDITPYTVKQLTPDIVRQESSYEDAYVRVVDHYWKNFGQKKLSEEAQVFRDSLQE